MAWSPADPNSQYLRVISERLGTLVAINGNLQRIADALEQLGRLLEDANAAMDASESLPAGASDVPDLLNQQTQNQSQTQAT